MNLNRRILTLLLLITCVPLFQGCATIVSDRQYPVAFENSGGRTFFEVRDRKDQLVHQGVTPANVTLDAKSSAFRPAKYTVTFAGSGAYSQHRELKAGFDPWVAGNIVLGGGLGAIVDGASGAMFKLPKQVTADVPSQYVVADPQQGARIASLFTELREASQSGLRQVEYRFAEQPDPQVQQAQQTSTQVE